MALKTELVDRTAVAHNAAEVYIQLGEVVIIIPPQVAKKLLRDLKSLPLPVGDDVRSQARPAESVPRRVIRTLYKSHKLTSTLLLVNTRRRKKLPDRD